MGLRIIIDGYNLMNASAMHPHLDPLPTFQAKRDRLLQMISNYQKVRGHDIKVIFDAHHGASRFSQRIFVGRVEVIYTPVGETADDMIVTMPKGDNSSLVVVSSDHHISRPLAAEGYTVITSDDFLKRLFGTLPPASPSPPSSFDKGWDDDEEDDLRGVKGKGPSHRPSKEKRRLSTILKKL